MARKSRTAAITVPEQQSIRFYNTAVYARLSIEDRRDKESDSIENQIYLIKQYIAERPYLKFQSVFFDNGETGTNFNRPGFNSMMDAVRAGKINCIVVKDLSRFGRNYIETGEYLEKIFPFMGVRFVSINDGLDNQDETCDTNAMIVSLKNLMNDIYAKDISQKTISVLHKKQLNGEYIGGLPPYGYKKSPQDYHRLVIDEETAPVVRDIYKWKSEGLGDTIIARRLNEAGVPSPAKRRIEKGEVKKTGQYNLYIWRDRTINLITTNPMYIGHMTQGRTRQALCENKRLKGVPKSEWIIVENTHEPIVDKETFEKAQEARANNTGAFYKNYDKSKHVINAKYLFKGILVCADCGSRLLRMKTHDNPVVYSFMCPVKRKNLGTSCINKTVSESYLHEYILEAVKRKIKAAADLTAIMERLNKRKSVSKSVEDLATRMANQQKEIKGLSNLKASLYTSYVKKLLTEDEYIYSKQQYEKKIEEAKQQLVCLQEESVLRTETLTSQNKWLQAVQRFTEHNEITPEMVNHLVLRVIVKSKNDFEIIWNFKNEYEALLEYTGGSV